MNARLITFVSALLLCIGISAQSTLNVGYVSDADNLSSIPYDGYRAVASYLSPDLVGKYAGSKVVGARIAVGATAFTSMRAWLSTDPNPNRPLADLATTTVDVSTLVEGWNTITFDKPYTLTGEEEELYIGYDIAYSNSDDRPVLISSARNSYALLVYETGGQGTGWYDYSATGSLAIQLVLEGGNLPDYDVALTNFSTDSHYYKNDAEELRFHVDLKNQGTKSLPGLTLNISIDHRNDLGGQMVIGEEIAATHSITQALPIADYKLAPGMHTLTISVAEVAEGISLSADTDGDNSVEATFAIYENASTRGKSILEMYVNQYSSYVPLQAQAVEQLLATRSDIIPIFIHGDYYGDDYPDEFAVPEAVAYAGAFGLEETPSLGFNRVVVPGATAMLQEISSSTIQSGYLGAMLDYINDVTPAFASMNITAAMSESEAGKLTLTVTGTRGQDFLNIFNSGALTVVLTEDSLVAPQADGEEMVEGYVHNHVLRRVVSSAAGDDITWSGLRFTRTYTIDLDPEWKVENMHAVAFIAKAISDSTTLDNVDITCAAQVDLADAATGAAVHDLRNTASQGNNTAIFDLAGRQVSSSLKPGIYVGAGKIAIRK